MKTKNWVQHMKERRARHPKILADIVSGTMTNKEIGKKYDITPQGVSWIKYEYGIAPGRTKKR